MKKQIFSLILITAVAIGLLASAQAQNPGPTPGFKMGIINIERAVVESDEGKKALEKVNAEFRPKGSELQAKQAEIERLRKELRAQEKSLNDEARGTLVRVIETKTRDFNRSNEDLSADYRQAQSQVFSEILQKVRKVLGQYALRNGYKVVIDISSPQTPVAWSSSTVDVTDDIIELYNASLIPSTSSAPGAATGTSGTPAARKPPSAQP